MALASRGGSIGGDADARVDIELADSVPVEDARAEITTEATSSWKATRVAESSGADDEATVEFALPGSSLNGFLAALRRNPDAASVAVHLDVDPDQLDPEPLASDSTTPETAEPEPVRVQVNLTAAQGQGPLVTIIGALLVAGIAAGALALVWRRFKEDGFHDDGAPPPGSARPEGSQRRWIQRP